MEIFYYNADMPILCLSGRDKNGKKYIVQIKDEKLLPRFMVLTDEWEKEQYRTDYIIKEEPGPDSLFGEHTQRLYTQFPHEVRRIRETKVCIDCDKIMEKQYGKDKKGDYYCPNCYEYFEWKDVNSLYSQTFQADVKWEKMAMSEIIYLLDLEGPYIKIPNDYAYKMCKVDDLDKVPEEEFFLIHYRICYWDIESDVREFHGRIKYKDFKNMPVLSITTYDSYDDEYYIFIWHRDFKEYRREILEGYEIPDNIGAFEHEINRVVRIECVNEEQMFLEFFSYFGELKPDVLFGYFSEGGYKKQSGVRKWVNGFDMPCVYARARRLGLMKEMQQMSICPKKKRRNGRWQGVYLRMGRGNKREIVIKGVNQVDFVFTDEVFDFARKHDDFRGGNLASWLKYFFDYHKLDKQKYRVWQYWEQEDVND